MVNRVATLAGSMGIAREGAQSCRDHISFKCPRVCVGFTKCREPKEKIQLPSCLREYAQILYVVVHQSVRRTGEGTTTLRCGGPLWNCGTTSLSIPKRTLEGDVHIINRR